MRVWWIAAAGLVVIGLGVAGFAIFGPGFAAKAQVQYLSSNAAVANVIAQVVANGTVQAAHTDSLAFGSPAVVQAATPTSGSGNGTQAAASTGGSGITWSVATVDVAVGDHVKAGDPLASASTTAIDAQITVAQAQVNGAQAQVDRGGSTQTVANAKAALLNAQTSLADLVAARANASLVAPEAGTVIALNLTKGASAPSGAAVVLASDAMVASGTVTETDVSAITVGQKATITLSALSADLTGSVSYVAPTGSATSGVVGFGILVTLDSVPAGTRPGMSADITVITREVDGALSVPSVALNGSVGSYTVTVLASDGTTAVRQVGVGLVTDNLAQITSGLTAGEAVVTGTASTQLTTTNGGGGFRVGGGGFGGGGFPGGGFGGGGN
jgi:macrolide-specific efflux system membrane fusion protein